MKLATSFWDVICQHCYCAKYIGIKLSYLYSPINKVLKLSMGLTNKSTDMEAINLSLIEAIYLTGPAKINHLST